MLDEYLSTFKNLSVLLVIFELNIQMQAKHFCARNLYRFRFYLGNITYQAKIYEKCEQFS